MSYRCPNRNIPFGEFLAMKNGAQTTSPIANRSLLQPQTLTPEIEFPQDVSSWNKHDISIQVLPPLSSTVTASLGSRLSLSYSLALIMMTLASALILLACRICSQRNPDTSRSKNGVFMEMVGLVTQILRLVIVVATFVVRKTVECACWLGRNYKLLRFFTLMNREGTSGRKAQQNSTSPDHTDNNDDNIISRQGNVISSIIRARNSQSTPSLVTAGESNYDIVLLPSSLDEAGVYPVSHVRNLRPKFASMYENDDGNGDLSRLYQTVGNNENGNGNGDDGNDKFGTTKTSPKSAASIKSCYPPASEKKEKVDPVPAARAVSGLGLQKRSAKPDATETSSKDQNADAKEPSRTGLSYRPSVKWRNRQTTMTKDKGGGNSTAAVAAGEARHKKRFSRLRLAGSSLALMKSELVASLSGAPAPAPRSTSATATAPHRDRKDRLSFRPPTPAPTLPPSSPSASASASASASSPSQTSSSPKAGLSIVPWTQDVRQRDQQGQQSPVSPTSLSGSTSTSTSPLAANPWTPYRLARKSSKNALKETVSSKLRFIRRPTRSNRLS